MDARGVALTGILSAISRADAARAATARTQTKLEAAIAMLLLLAAFAYFYFRSLRPTRPSSAWPVRRKHCSESAAARREQTLSPAFATDGR